MAEEILIMPAKLKEDVEKANKALAKVCSMQIKGLKGAIKASVEVRRESCHYIKKVQQAFDIAEDDDNDESFIARQLT